MSQTADPLVAILKSYGTLKNPRVLNGLHPSDFISLHVFLLDHVLLNPHFETYPPSHDFQASFWKWAIQLLEGLATDEDEIDERIYMHQVHLMQDSSLSGNVGSHRPQTSYVTYMWPASYHLGSPVYPGHENATLLESRTTVEAGTTGFRTWSASLALAEYMIGHPDLVQGHRVLELGCGVGFLGIVLGTIQRTSIPPTDEPNTSELWLTDFHERVLERCEHNVRLPCNRSHEHPNLHVSILDWSLATDSSTAHLVETTLNRMNADIIIGADIVYDPSIVPSLVAMLALALKPRVAGIRVISPVAYLALPIRNPRTYFEFVEQAEIHLAIEELQAGGFSNSLFVASTELGSRSDLPGVKILRIHKK